MKRTTVSSLLLLFASFLFAQYSHAQDYNRWRLPEGAPHAAGQRQRARRGVVTGPHAPGRGGQRRHLALRCRNRVGSFPDHRTCVQSQWYCVFARRSHAGEWQSGQNGTVVGRGNGTGKEHPHGTYLRRGGGYILAGWNDPGKRQSRRYGAGVGRGHRAGRTYPRK